MDSNPCAVGGRFSRCHLKVLAPERHRLRVEAPWKVFGPVRGEGTCFTPESFQDSPAFYLSNSTAGILSGDRLEAEIRIAPGASARIIVPSATKVFSMPGGGAGQKCSFHIGTGAGLFYYGNQLIPYAKADYYQDYEYRLEPEANLAVLEYFVPGRLAGGECFAFSRIKLRSRIFFDGSLVLDDRLYLEPLDLLGRNLTGVITPETPIIGTCYLAGPLAESVVNNLDNSGVKAGFTSPCPGLLVGRAFGGNVQEVEAELIKVFRSGYMPESLLRQ